MSYIKELKRRNELYDKVLNERGYLSAVDGMKILTGEWDEEKENEKYKIRLQILKLEQKLMELG